MKGKSYLVVISNLFNKSIKRRTIMSKRKIILDVDTGTDDAMAIITALLSKQLDVLAITVVHGNQFLQYTVENTCRVVELLKSEVPIYAGCPDPMVQTMSEGRMKNQRTQTIKAIINGEEVSIHDRYLDLPEATIKPQKEHAVSFIVNTLRNTKEKLTVVAVGPMTNIGMALRMDPSIANNIEEMVIMGGGVQSVNRTSAAEMNFYLDPEAAQIMIKANCKITLFPLDATTSALFSYSDAQQLIDLNNPVAKFFGELITHFIDRITLLGISMVEDPHCHDVAIHDVLCILYLLNPNIVLKMKKERCDVDFAGGIADGQLIIDTRSYWPKDRETYVAYKIDKALVLSMLKDILAS